MNSIWIKNLEIRCEILKLLEENIVKTSEFIVIGKDVLNVTPSSTGNNSENEQMRLH